MKLLKTNFEVLVISLVLIVLTAETVSGRKFTKRVVIHVPMKVKHHHHTHTVMKHVHHQVPVHYDHHDVHVIHPETSEDYDGDFHLSHGRTMEYLDNHSSHSDDADQGNGYEEFERYLRKRSKNKQKLFSNKVIGWKGRKDFDKIASEYLASIKKQRIPAHDDYDEHYSAYDDDSRKKRK